jgi:hypothetical protein
LLVRPAAVESEDSALLIELRPNSHEFRLSVVLQKIFIETLHFDYARSLMLMLRAERQNQIARQRRCAKQIGDVKVSLRVDFS